MIFRDRDGGDVHLLPADWSHVDLWDLVLCPAVLVSRKEVLMLLAERVLKKRTRDAMITISNCDLLIGRHVAVTMSTGDTLHYYGVGGQRWKQNKHATWVEVGGYDKTTRRSTRMTSRLASVVCGIQLRHVIDATGEPVPVALRDVKGDKGKNTVTFLLVKYAAAHESATERGPDHRPMCPGPLQHTHCLWKWATRRAGYTRGCFRPRPWERNKRYFGRTPLQQQGKREFEQRAWYDLIQVNNIKCYANVHNVSNWDEPTLFVQSLLWG